MGVLELIPAPTIFLGTSHGSQRAAQTTQPALERVLCVHVRVWVELLVLRS